MCDFIYRNIAPGVASERIEINTEKENKNFFKQCWQAARKNKPEITNPPCPVDRYDFFVFASPLWAYTMAPAMRAYLENIRSLSGKKVAWIFTYNGAAGRALREAEGCIRSRGGSLLFSKALYGNKVSSQDYLGRELASLLVMLEGPR